MPFFYFFFFFFFVVVLEKSAETTEIFCTHKTQSIAQHKLLVFIGNRWTANFETSSRSDRPRARGRDSRSQFIQKFYCRHLLASDIFVLKNIDIGSVALSRMSNLLIQARLLMASPVNF